MPFFYAVAKYDINHGELFSFIYAIFFLSSCLFTRDITAKVELSDSGWEIGLFRSGRCSDRIERFGFVQIRVGRSNWEIGVVRSDWEIGLSDRVVRSGC